jgi:hypothetical protein
LSVLGQVVPEEEDDDEAAVEDEDDELDVDASASGPPSVRPPVPPKPPPDPELEGAPPVLALELDMPPVPGSSLRVGKQLTAAMLGTAMNASRAMRLRSTRIRKPP